MNSSAANLRTAVKGAASGTLNLLIIGEVIIQQFSWSNRIEKPAIEEQKTYTLKGSFGSDVSMILKDTLPPPAAPPAPLAI